MKITSLPVTGMSSMKHRAGASTVLAVCMTALGSPDVPEV